MDRPQCVTVRFEGGSRVGFTYWTHIPDLKVGDTVVCEAPRDERGNLVKNSEIALVGKVYDANPPETMCKKAYKWVVCRIDWEAHRARSALVPPPEGEDDDA